MEGMRTTLETLRESNIEVSGINFGQIRQSEQVCVLPVFKGFNFNRINVLLGIYKIQKLFVVFSRLQKFYCLKQMVFFVTISLYGKS